MKIAFIGRMMSGKTTSADYLVRHENFTRLAFADPVKIISAKLLNVVGMEIHGDKYWNQVDAFWDYDKVQSSKGIPAVRKLLQLVGTEIGRDLVGYKDVWVDMLIEQVDKYENVVVDDCRFPNEAQALKDNGFTLVRVTRREEDRIAMIKSKYPTTFEEILAHPSETSLDDFEADTWLDAADIEELHSKLDELVRQVRG